MFFSNKRPVPIEYINFFQLDGVRDELFIWIFDYIYNKRIFNRFIVWLINNGVIKLLRTPHKIDIMLVEWIKLVDVDPTVKIHICSLNWLLKYSWMVGYLSFELKCIGIRGIHFGIQFFQFSYFSQFFLTEKL